MANALAGLASVLWGCSDYFGGLATKHWDVRRVGALSQSIGLIVVASVLVVAPADPAPNDLWWGVTAGVATAFGAAMLYQSLAIGPMHIAAPTTAVVGAAITALLGLVGGERPGALALVGVPLALLSIALIGFSSPSNHVGQGSPWLVLLLAVGAGVCLGIFNASFAATSPESGLWSVGVSRLVASILLGTAALISPRGSTRSPKRGLKPAIATGLADVGATISIALALQRGSEVLVGVIASLFPVVTVLLARMFLNEAMNRMQLIGLCCAVVAVALMASA
jgi:drug/metabolite transporter (DMT)-like permease